MNDEIVQAINDFGFPVIAAFGLGTLFIIHGIG